MREVEIEVSRWLQRSVNRAIAFFGLVILLMGLSSALAWTLIRLSPPVNPGWLILAAFAGSTLSLFAASVMLIRAAAFVRQEKQSEFRRSLQRAVVCGVTFVALQSWAMWCLLSHRQIAEALDLRNAAFAFVFLHGMHVVVALLAVSWVYLLALADRYDHEYFWGVTFCGWFWHGLGLVWLVIMCAFVVAGSVLIH